jgi:hypothetical protein
MPWTLNIMSITDFTKIGPFVTATVTKCVSRWAATNMGWLHVEQAPDCRSFTASNSQDVFIFRPVRTSDITVTLTVGDCRSYGALKCLILLNESCPAFHKVPLTGTMMTNDDLDKVRKEMVVVTSKV